MYIYYEPVVAERDKYDKIYNNAVFAWSDEIYKRKDKLESIDSKGVTLEVLLHTMEIRDEIDTAVYEETGIVSHTPIHFVYNDGEIVQLCIETPPYKSIILGIQHGTGSQKGEVTYDQR